MVPVAWTIVSNEFDAMHRKMYLPISLTRIGRRQLLAMVPRWS
ncbi:hypothetical protein BSU04_23695 [Caballeronia sordidicola]|uniref:Uncharacterized protein n=1 Tax=Caballeronia sordidicola TaxID=196367 RepID=A0A226WY29_CABSO|nr:hypothetical protein BSU04_23695 [Caballeronia sordidicola]